MNALGPSHEGLLVVVPHAWASIEEGLLSQALRRPHERLGAQRSHPGGHRGLRRLTTRGGSWWPPAPNQTGIQSYRDLGGKRVGHFKDRVVSRAVQSLATSTLVAVEDLGRAGNSRSWPRGPSTRWSRIRPTWRWAGSGRTRAFEPWASASTGDGDGPRAAPGGRASCDRAQAGQHATSWPRETSNGSAPDGRAEKRRGP